MTIPRGFRFRSLLFVLATLVAMAAPVGAQEDDMEFEPEGIEEAGPPSKTLGRGLKFYDKGDYYSASIELYKVVQGETNDSAANKQRAEFFLGKTMYQMKYYAAALAYFDQIVQTGAPHRYFGITLKWLAALAKVLPESSGILERVGQYSRDELEDPALDKVRGELYYLLGKHFYREGDLEQATELFQSVPETSDFYVKARFFEGVSHVRQYEGAPAIEAFKDILVIAQEPELRKKYPPEDIMEFEELANLSMARVFYSTGQYETSIKYYEKIPQDSPYWVQSIFEASWAYFLRNTNSKALGNIHTLAAPYFEDMEEEYFAEGLILKAIIFFNYCRYARAQEALAEFEEVYPQIRDNILELTRRNSDDNAEFYKYVLKVRSGRAGLPERTQQMAKAALSDKTLLKSFAWVDELDRELKQYEKSDKAWRTTASAGEVLQELSVQKSLAEAEAGRLARERLNRIEEGLRELRRDATKIKIEILNAKAGQKADQLRQQEVTSVGRQEAIVVDDEHYAWNFNGEWWKDELGFYRFRVASQCVRKK